MRQFYSDQCSHLLCTPGATWQAALHQSPRALLELFLTHLIYARDTRCSVTRVIQVSIFKMVNLKGDLFATSASFAAQGIIRVGSSMVLTRILLPEAYGTVTIITSIAFVVSMLADTNVTLFIIRDKNGDEPRYLNTAFTIGLGRAAINCAAIILLAPVIASRIYDAPMISAPLRVYAFTFIISAFQSMSFSLAIRRQRARVIMYAESVATFVSSAFSIVYCHYSRDFWGIIYGILMQRAVLTVWSFYVYPEERPRLQFDRGAAIQLLGFTKYVMPSSLLTLAITQFDKVIFLRLFNLTLLGLYGLAGNIAGQIEALISKISQAVLYPRCAEYMRADPDTAVLSYYTKNTKLFANILLLPAAVGGAAHLVIAILYPARYAEAGVVLQAFMLRAVFAALACPAEDLLIAAGEFQVILHGNVFRTTGAAFALLGYYCFGFVGFAYGTALGGLPPLLYYWSLQNKKGMLIVKYEAYKVLFVIVVALTSYLISTVLHSLWRDIRA
jgi:lipopolysaccharide exporter